MGKGGGIKANKEPRPDWLNVRPANDNAFPLPANDNYRARRAANDNARPMSAQEKAIANIDAAWAGTKGMPPPVPKRAGRGAEPKPPPPPKRKKK